jgi:hypothetical protein
MFFALTNEIRRAMNKRGISEKAFLSDFEKARKFRPR